MPVITQGGSLVTSANIVNGTIVNEDINASAAIDVSKLNNAAYAVLADVTLSGAGNTIDSSTFTAKRLIKVLLSIPSIAIASTVTFRFNADSGANYDTSCTNDGAAAFTGTAQSVISPENVNSTSRRFIEFEVINDAALQKMLFGRSYYSNGQYIFCGSWNNTANQITRVQAISAQNFATGSRMVVLGMN